MAYRYDSYDNSIVLDGFENGIAPSPHKGISDMRNVNIVSVPGEASVNFTTTNITLNSSSGNVASADSANDTITVSGATNPVANGMTVIFTGASLPGGVSAATVYWVGNSNGTTFKIYSASTYGASLVDITTTGTGTYATTGTLGKPTQRCYYAPTDRYFELDSNGRAFEINLQSFGVPVWLGNSTLTNAHGNGMIAWKGYLFVFRDAVIDIMKLSDNTWTYGWKSLNSAGGSSNSHYAVIGQDDAIYFCDSSYVGSLLQVAGSTFDPTTATTYTYNNQALALPTYETAQCLAELGINLLVGGSFNQIYPWNRTATSFTYPILIAENFIVRMVTVNTNTYIFAGVRGRIYITNGSQAQLYKKVPDHISNTVEPYFSWGDATSVKNQLYFGVKATDNVGTAINQYGGAWAIDLDTDAIRLTNELSYGSYAGLATTFLPIAITSATSTPAGVGMYIGWDSGSSTFGIDKTSSNPYTGSQATIDFDLIPIGTYSRPRENTRIEYKLTKPMVSGESITLKWRQDFSQSYTSVLTDSTVGNFSLDGPINWKNSQWLQIQAVLNSTSSTPSYTRLKEVRISGVSSSQSQ